MLFWTFYFWAKYWYLRLVLADSAITWARIICIQYCRHDTCPLPGLAARQSRHSVKLVNLTSPLTTFAKTMQQHVRLIKKLAQLIRFQSASLPNNYRDPPPPVNLWPVARGGQGAATSPGLSIEVGCLINGRTKQQNTLHHCNVSPSCSVSSCSPAPLL